MLVPIISAGIFLIVLERIIPDQKLPNARGWWLRVIIINLIQLGIIILASFTWDLWFLNWKPHPIVEIPPTLGGFISYVLVTFIFYWWHRLRHELNFLWLLFHQVHHSPRRIETVTSFYKHPFEIICNSIILGSINYLLLGLTIESASWCLLYSSLAEYFYHMNIKTPHLLGYFFQRPEMHRIHHQRGRHRKNFSDFPIWDLCFGTFTNPKTYQGKCGFKPGRETKLIDMFLFKNVNNPYPRPQKD